MKVMKFLRRVWRQINDWRYNAKCFFFPHNVLKVSGCPRTWSDRDNLMFHAMFQILVDFVELEQRLAPWDERRGSGRFTDIPEMRKFIETNYGPDADIKNMFGEDTEKNPALTKEAREFNKKSYSYLSELLYLYHWYKVTYPNKLKWEDVYQDLTEHYDFADGKIVTIKNKEGFITSHENQEIEDENDLIEDVMLRRILKIRRGMWT